MRAVLSRERAMNTQQPPAPHRPPSWGDPPTWRGCQLCDHGANVADQRVCTCRHAVAPAQHQPVELVRRHGGACGPEAEYLSFPGLRG